MPKRSESYDRRCGRHKTKSSLYFRNLDHSTKTTFKTICVRREDVMQDVVEALMRLYIKKPEIANDELKVVKKRKLQPEVKL